MSHAAYKNKGSAIGVSPVAAGAELWKKLEDYACWCGAKTDHRDRANWEYCGTHVLIDKLRTAIASELAAARDRALKDAENSITAMINPEHVAPGQPDCGCCSGMQDAIDAIQALRGITPEGEA